MSAQPTESSTEIRVVDTPIPSQRTKETVEGTYEAELWCEFDCVAYVFIGNDPNGLTQRLNEARAGEQTWDYVRPLSREELYNFD